MTREQQGELGSGEFLHIPTAGFEQLADFILLAGFCNQGADNLSGFSATDIKHWEYGLDIKLSPEEFHQASVISGAFAGSLRAFNEKNIPDPLDKFIEKLEAAEAEDLANAEPEYSSTDSLAAARMVMDSTNRYMNNTMQGTKWRIE